MSDKAPKDRQQKGAEAEVEEFKKNLGPFVTATEATRMPMAFTDARKADHPIIFANDVLQGRPERAKTTAVRFLVNSTAGFGGLVDAAAAGGLPRHSEDFGQTLAVWGVPSGPFVNLPLFGPSTVRDAPARAVDWFTNPLQYTDLPWEAEWGERVINIVHTRSELLPLDETLQRTFDPYAFIRDAWVQQREFNIYDGNPPPETLEDVLGEDFEEDTESQQ